jgi:putative membrane protein
MTMETPDPSRGRPASERQVMTHDYLTLLLLNLAAGLAALGAYFFWGAGGQHHGPAWAGPFAAVGLVALLGGLHMALTWPMQTIGGNDVRWTNLAFGEPTVLFGAAFLAAALALWRGWSLAPVGIYTAVAGLAAIVIGVRLYSHGWTAAPAMTLAGFVLAGAAGILTLPAVSLGQVKVLRYVAGAVSFAAAAVWAFVGLGAYWKHLTKGFFEGL